MAKILNPHSVSTTFGVSAKQLRQLGVLDATLSADTRLFVDPLLFKASRHAEFRNDAVMQYHAYFEKVAKFLQAAPLNDPTHVAYVTVRKLLHFHELATCLGYGASSDDGSGWGPELVEQVLRVAKQIVDLGVMDPDLFVSMALFESGIGPDRISDMSSNVAIDAFIAFNARIIQALNLKGLEFSIRVADRKVTATLLPNPYLAKTPVILVPRDILRKLPVALDWDGVAHAAAESEQIRTRVNKHIAHIWEKKTKRDAETLRKEAMANPESFRTLLDAIRAVGKIPYNSDDDPEALTQWATIALEAAKAAPLNLEPFSKLPDLDAVHKMVRAITDQFRMLVERRGLWRDLYKDNSDPRHESTAQRMYFAIAYSYCNANNVDISPEVDTGSGKIDFKMSKGFKARVIVEIKLSRNNKVVSGFSKQLEIYKSAEETTRGIYVVIDVGGMNKKDKNLIQLRNEAIARKEAVSDLLFVDGLPKVSASKQ